MDREQKLIRDLVKYYNKHQKTPHMAGAGILDGLKKAFQKVVQLGRSVVSNKDLQEMVKGCIKKNIKEWTGSGMVNDDDMVLEFVDIYKKYRPHQQEMSGGFLGVVAAIISQLGSLAAQLSPHVIKAIKNCVLGAMDARLKKKRGGVIPVRYAESNFKSSFQPDGAQVATHKKNRIVGGANKWLDFSKNLKKGDVKSYNGQRYTRMENGRITKL
jgi:hypothetical protein